MAPSAAAGAEPGQPKQNPRGLLQICLQISPSCKVQGLFEDLADRETFVLGRGFLPWRGFVPWAVFVPRLRTNTSSSYSAAPVLGSKPGPASAPGLGGEEQLGAVADTGTAASLSEENHDAIAGPGLQLKLKAFSDQPPPFIPSPSGILRGRGQCCCGRVSALLPTLAGLWQPAWLCPEGRMLQVTALCSRHPSAVPQQVQLGADAAQTSGFQLHWEVILEEKFSAGLRSSKFRTPGRKDLL